MVGDDERLDGLSGVTAARCNGLIGWSGGLGAEDVSCCMRMILP
jgi:hypothetical protein